MKKNSQGLMTLFLVCALHGMAFGQDTTNGVSRLHGISSISNVFPAGEYAGVASSGFFNAFGVEYDFTKRFSAMMSLELGSNRFESGRLYNNLQLEGDAGMTLVMLSGIYRFNDNAFRIYATGGVGALALAAPRLVYLESLSPPRLELEQKQIVHLALQVGVGAEIKFSPEFVFFVETCFITTAGETRLTSSTLGIIPIRLGFRSKLF
jgi:hypothetical protein